jgi:hypothetical protein
LPKRRLRALEARRRPPGSLKSAVLTVVHTYTHHTRVRACVRACMHANKTCMGRDMPAHVYIYLRAGMMLRWRRHRVGLYIAPAPPAVPGTDSDAKKTLHAHGRKCRVGLARPGGLVLIRAGRPRPDRLQACNSSCAC